MKIRNLRNIRRFVLTLFAALMTANLWGQATLSGEGTETLPYLINSTADWNKFATAVNNGYSYDNEYLKLTADITLTINNQATTDTMVGTVTISGSSAVEDKFFSGIFDGDWHTITFKVGNKNTPYTPATTVTPSAPFRVIDGATINNLTVTDTIYAGNKYNSGLVGFAWKTQGRDNYINNCTSSIVINCSGITPKINPDCSSAGFVAENKTSGSKLYFENCIFDGKIDMGTHETAQKCAGFLSYNNGSTVSYSHCTMAGTINLTSETATFHRKLNASFSNAYYITNYMNSTGSVSPQGVQATDTEPTDDLARKYTVSTTDYYVPGSVITGFETTSYYYDNSPIEVPVTVSYYGRTLARGTDYVIKINNEIIASGTPTLNADGVYAFAIAGMGDYAGEYRDTIRVTSIDTWAKLQALLYDNSHDRVIPLTANIQPVLPTDTALIVRGNVVLNMKGHTINRKLTSPVFYGQVIRVNSGANLTINGGTIKGGNNRALNTTGDGIYNDGGGIYSNGGHLTLNNVNVVYNDCVRINEADTVSATARGGGICCKGGSFIMRHGSVSKNSSKGGGGGIYCNGAYPFVMDTVEIWDNDCESKGAGIRINTTDAHTVYLRGCDISGNFLSPDGESKGAGVYLGNGSLYMENCTIWGNSSNRQGSGFFSMKGTTTAVNCEIYWNGTNTPHTENFGGGICLYDDKKSNHSVYIMDGGSIYENNSTENGGGVYVYDGAEFKVMGNVQILDNYKASVATGSTNNNAYVDGSSVIEVIGPLGPDAIINITPSGSGGTYVHIADSVPSAGIFDHFNVEDNEYRTIVDDEGNLVIYEPYSWNSSDIWNDTTIVKATNKSVAGFPTATSEVTLKRAMRIPSGCVALADTIKFVNQGELVIKDGGELLYNHPVSVVVEKDIHLDDENDPFWYLISAGVVNPNIEDNTNMLTTYHYHDSYDLYRFNEGAALQWENYRASHSDFDVLEKGRGYLYRTRYQHIVNISGTTKVDTVRCKLSYHTTVGGQDNVLRGFNLIGNPYTHTIYKGAAGSAIPNGELLASNYYVLNSSGSWILTGDGTAIAPMSGILVQATQAGTLIMANSTTGAGGVKSASENIWFTVRNNMYEDKACVEFNEGHGLNKMAHQNDEAPMLYVRHNGEDFGSADLDSDVKEFGLYFKAMTSGKYTLNIKTQGQFGYLHLIDRLEDKDIDLLQNDEYSFMGSSADREDRFVVRLRNVNANDDDEEFAYQSGDEIVVDGNGELQVFDVAGRLVAKQYVNGLTTWHTASVPTGMYVLRLVGNEVKTQKIIVR